MSVTNHSLRCHGRDCDNPVPITRKWCSDRCRKLARYSGTCGRCGARTYSETTAMPPTTCSRCRCRLDVGECVTRDDGTIAIPLCAVDRPPQVWAIIDECDREHATTDWRWRHGYVVRSRGRRTERLHRVILGLPVRHEGLEADHINRDTLDNRRANLRIVTPAQNRQNSAAHIDAVSRYRGVSPSARGWVAQVTVGGVTHRLGVHQTEIAAAQICEAFRRQHMPYALPDPALSLPASS